MAALLSSEIEDGNKRDIMVEHIDDARRLGVEVLPPDVNAGEADFTVADGKIVFGLTAIKGVGRGAAAGDRPGPRREGTVQGPLRLLRAHRSTASSAGPAIEKLIKAGAFDSLSPTRATDARAAASAAGSRRAAARPPAGPDEPVRCTRAGIGNRESGIGEQRSSLGIPDVPEWSNREKLRNEKEALDFYITSHPLAQYEETLRRFSSHSVDQIGSLGANQEVFIGGMLAKVRYLNVKKARDGNSRYVRMRLEDLTGAIECVLWPDDYLRLKEEVEEDRVCFVEAAVERTREEPGLVVRRIVSTEQAERERTKGVVLLLSLGTHTPDIVDALARVLKRAQGSCPVYLTIQDTAGKRALESRGRVPRQYPGLARRRAGNHSRSGPRQVFQPHERKARVALTLPREVWPWGRFVTCLTRWQVANLPHYLGRVRIRTRDDYESSPKSAFSPTQKMTAMERAASRGFTLDEPARRFSKMIGVSPIRLPAFRQR